MGRFRRSVVSGTKILINSPIVAGLIGASFGLVLANLSFTQSSGPSQWALVGFFISAVLAAVFVLNKLNGLNIDVLQLRNAAHLLRIDETTGGADIVKGLVQNCKVIRVIGRARQDQLSRPESSQRHYLEVTESAVVDGTMEVYRRITGDVLRAPFREHLGRLIDARKDGQIVELSIAPNFDAFISYQVFDRTAALIGIETASVPGVRDSTVVLLTYRQELIDALIAHFDSAWTGLAPISDKQAFLEATSDS